MDVPGTGTVRDYPRLRYGGKHLGEHEGEAAADAAFTAFRGAALAFVGWLGLAGLAAATAGRGAPPGAGWGRIWRRETTFAWDSVLLTLLLMLLVLVPLFWLSGQYHVFGTDKVGQDVLYQVLKSVRTGLIIGLVTTLVMLPMAVLLGIVAGYFRGWIDDVMMRAVDVLDSIPLLFLVVFLVTVLGEDSVRLALDSLGIGRLAIFYAVVAAVSWLSMARIVRAKVLEIRGATMIEAARAIGAGPARIISRHLLPNLAGIIIVKLSLVVPRVMLFESFLSFLGLGVQPPDVSWGLLANAGFRALVPFDPAWWLFLFPATALAVTLLAFGFLGDGLGAGENRKWRP